ncbi:hypothetical protein SynMVIR181_00249 [Synechococcus sp. MVIR-18-1]|nr:hypothetical protein SynMVIR181_00249 [Synechococcus sp. MVIR-18-1]
MSLVSDLLGRLRKEIQLVAKAINELFLSSPHQVKSWDRHTHPATVV